MSWTYHSDYRVVNRMREAAYHEKWEEAWQLAHDAWEMLYPRTAHDENAAEELSMVMDDIDHIVTKEWVWFENA